MMPFFRDSACLPNYYGPSTALAASLCLQRYVARLAGLANVHMGRLSSSAAILLSWVSSRVWVCELVFHK